MTTSPDTCATTHGNDAGHPAGKVSSLSASRGEFNHGAPWARGWIETELSRASPHLDAVKRRTIRNSATKIGTA